ncbi:MAG: sulfite exporter TauE/SafE family protein [Alphaproteobacteria bacterium]|nr:sulfite exporter TauE/SafE family protein [Alphaproteobacteria bacterium]
MDPVSLSLAAVGLFIAGVLKGATGLGYSSCALPFLAAALGLKTAIALVVIPAMISNLTLLWSTGHFRQTVQRFALFYAAMLPGIAIGLYALTWVNPRSAEMVLGALIIIYSLYSILRPIALLPAGLERPLQTPAGMLNGFLTGLTGSQVMPLLPYMLSLGLGRAELVQATNIAVTLASGFMAIGLLGSGLMTLPGLGASILAIVPAMAGVMLGTRLRRLIPEGRFKLVVLVVLGLLGVGLIVR